MLFERSPSASPAAELWIELAVGWDFLTTSFIPVQSNTFPGGTVRTTVLPLSSKTLAPGAAAVTRYKQGNAYFLTTLTTGVAGSTSSDKSISSDTSAALAAASSRDKDVTGKGSSKTEQAGLVGKLIAEKALAAGVTAIRFDRGGYLYHGRVKSLAEGARGGGLKF